MSKDVIIIGPKTSERRQREDSKEEVLHKLRPQYTIRSIEKFSFFKGGNSLTFDGLVLLYCLCVTSGVSSLIVSALVLSNQTSDTIASESTYLEGCESLDIVSTGTLVNLSPNSIQTSNISFFNSIWILPSKPIKYNGVNDFREYIQSSQFPTQVGRKFYWDLNFISYAFQSNDLLIALLYFQNESTTVNISNFNYIYYFDGFDSVRFTIKGDSFDISILNFNSELDLALSVIDSNFPLKKSLCSTSSSLTTIAYTSVGLSLSIFNITFILFDFLMTRQWFVNSKLMKRFVKDNRQSSKDLYIILEELWSKIQFIEFCVGIDTKPLGRPKTREI
jgi:hypothetical protein